MVVVTKDTVVPEYKKTVNSHVICDLCNTSNEKHYNAGEGNWTDSIYEINNVTIQHESGTSYPGDYNTTTIKFDICPNCFEHKLVPWLTKQGAEASIIENEV